MEIYPQDKIALRWGVSLGLASLCFFVGGWGIFVTLRGSAQVMRWNHLVFCFALGAGGGGGGGGLAFSALAQTLHRRRTPKHRFGDGVCKAG